MYRTAHCCCRWDDKLELSCLTNYCLTFKNKNAGVNRTLCFVKSSTKTLNTLVNLFSSVKLVAVEAIFKSLTEVNADNNTSIYLSIYPLQQTLFNLMQHIIEVA